jgi:hypothetical protein
MSQPKNTPISVIMDHLGNKTPVERMVVKLVSLKTMLKDKADPPQWSLQNGEIQDAAGDRMPIVFKDRYEEVPTSWAGREIILECKHGDKSMSGVYVFDDNYKPPAGQEYVRKIKVTATGEVSLLGGGGPSHSQGGQQRQQYSQQQPQDNGRGQTARQADPPANRQQTQSAPPPAEGLAATRHFLGQCMMAWTLCHDTATAMAWAVYDRHGQLTPGGAVGMMTDKLFIELAKSGHIRNMPVGDPRKLLKAPPRKLGDLTALLGEAATEAAVNKAEALRAAEHAKAVQAKHDRQAQEQQPQQQEEDTGKSYRDGLEDDDIPF